MIAGGVVAGVTGLLATTWNYLKDRKLQDRRQSAEDAQDQADVALAGLKAQLDGWKSYAQDLRDRNRELESENDRLRAALMRDP